MKKGLLRMAAVNVDKMSLKDLQDLDVALDHAIAGVKDRDRAELKAKIETMLASHGLSLSDLYGTGSAARGRGGKSSAKYANPDNRSQTWTGRGRKPNWLNARLKKGAKVEDFAI